MPAGQLLSKHSFPSIILTILSGGGYGIGFTLRFPRCKYIYYDKNSRDYELDDESKERDMWTCVSLFKKKSV